jgi:hypothetical protein
MAELAGLTAAAGERIDGVAPDGAQTMARRGR